MKKKKYFIMLFLLFITVITAGIGVTVVASTDEEDKIGQGVYIDSISVGGMTEQEAEQAVKDYIDTLKSKAVTISIADTTVSTTVGELGLDAAENSHIEDAMNVGKAGNLIKRYKELKDIENEGLVYPLEFSVEDNKIKEFVKEQCTGYDIEGKNATLTRENGTFVITDDVVGQKVSIEDTVEKIKSSILNDWDQNDITIDAVVVEDIPKYTKESLEKCNTILGTFSTTYASSSESRANNLANGAKLINGTILYPGDVFSAYEKLAPFTTENGYYAAGAYQQGKVVDSIGGGACQVTTTLYNAVLRAELEIVERAPHSMIVSYVEPAMDAAIAGTYKNLRFKNNTDSPVYIEAHTIDRTITFNIWGHETRDTENRKISFVSEVVEVIQPGADKITEDPTKPSSYSVVTQSAHVGYKAYLYKVVTVNGVQQSKEQVNYSTYAAEPRHVTVGAKAEATPSPSPTPTPTPEPTEEPLDSKPVSKPQNTDKKPVFEATSDPTPTPTQKPTPEPTKEPIKKPEAEPTPEPTKEPEAEPTPEPTKEPEAAEEPQAENEEEDVQVSDEIETE